ncbi:tRNA1Val (adenine37-N6)-methyltransferase [Parabacteroides sp. PFB2-10]|uniref:tRNA1(Val) (adenine(37)-N6)-methyltransferase n=1 Tax=Parabacteroides sp. PFB2-10 TaxID=1742405 RepID=UPI0024739B92|nr:methyltransferase [Parabacteroides sp. PFB2-10]MDH6311717.1 tRNA1Val (adenine37-N6)-methyltransferase [Parabacteroides sp. PFB2-10]
MPNSFFHFKQFTIRHDKCAMKVGTDGVLLGAWAYADKAKRVLDIGTGSGLIALMIAQRSQALIDAIDIDEGAYVQSLENVADSPFSERIRVFHQSLEQFASEKRDSYDLIVSNPPYFISSLKPPTENRSIARHTDTLALDDLIRLSRSMLSDDGRLALILPYDQEKQLYDLTESEGLFVIRQTNVIPVVGSSPKRLLVEIIQKPSPTLTIETLTIEVERHKYTPEYQTLTSAYYLNM